MITVTVYFEIYYFIFSCFGSVFGVEHNFAVMEESPEHALRRKIQSWQAKTKAELDRMSIPMVIALLQEDTNLEDSLRKLTANTWTKEDENFYGMSWHAMKDRFDQVKTERGDLIKRLNAATRASKRRVVQNTNNGALVSSATRNSQPFAARYA